MAIDFEVFDGKTLSDVFKDIYDNSQKNKVQLEVLMKEVVGFIKDGDTAVQIIPMLKEYLEINVKNDDQLVKMAGIVQRLISAENKHLIDTLDTLKYTDYMNKISSKKIFQIKEEIKKDKLLINKPKKNLIKSTMILKNKISKINKKANIYDYISERNEIINLANIICPSYTNIFSFNKIIRIII